MIEDFLAGLLDARVSPLVEEMRRLREEVEQLRAALPPQLVTVQEAAERLGISVSTVRRQIKEGVLPIRRIGRSVRVDLSRLHGLDGEDVVRLAHRALAPVRARSLTS